MVNGVILSVLIQVRTFNEGGKWPVIVSAPFLTGGGLVIKRALCGDSRAPILLFRGFGADARLLHDGPARLAATVLLSTVNVTSILNSVEEQHSVGP